MTRSTLTSTASAAASAGENGGPEARQRARRAAWEQRVAAVAVFTATVADPLPPLPVMRLALAARCQGLDALAAGEPLAGLGPSLLRRLRRAAARWMRWRPAEAPDPADRALRRHFNCSRRWEPPRLSAL